MTSESFVRPVVDLEPGGKTASTCSSKSLLVPVSGDRCSEPNRRNNFRPVSLKTHDNINIFIV